MRFEVVMSNSKTYIFTTPTTFHGPTIGYHDLKIIDSTNITIGFLGNAMMNKIVGATIVNKDDDLPILNIANELEGLWSREVSEGMQGNEWFNFRWVSGILGSIGKGGLFNKWNCHIFFEEHLREMAIKIFCSLHLCP
jgi:hypothetical protein